MASKEATLEWKRQMEIGVDEIDFQHRYFLELVIKFKNQVSNPESTEKVKRYLKELSYYAQFHFFSEENLMIEYNYPDYIHHKEIHFNLIEELNNLYLGYEIDKSNLDEIIQFLIDWFIEHTSGEDKKLGNFIKKLNEK